MKKNIIVLFFLFCLFFIPFSKLNSQNLLYNSSFIPDSIKDHADAVIRNHQTDIKINSYKSADFHIKEVITILKKSGEKFAYIKTPYDDNLIKFIYLKEKVYDKNGLLKKTITKKDIKDVSSYEGLFSDNRMKYVNKPLLDPPYTIEYEIKLHYNGILNFERWFPVSNYHLGVQKAVLNVYSPEGYKYRIKEKNFNGTKKEEKFKTIVQKTWKIENIKPVLSEPYITSFTELVPVIYIDPSDFSMEDFDGNMDTWQNFGNWIIKLNGGRDNLSENTIAEIQDLTKNCSDDKEKAKIVYNYMQNKTRYVSIQLGIGGWQPFETAYTDRNGYGDCKALSFYTKSLLNAIGIKSYYTVVRAGGNASNIDTSYPSLQFNHAILCVPFKEDTIWLECTDQKIPFGYLSDFTDDRDVLVITENGGKIMHTTSYSEQQNTQIRKGNIKLHTDGSIDALIHTEYNGLQYDNVSSLEDLPEKDKIKKIKSRLSIPSLVLDSFSYKNYKEIIPHAEEFLKFNVKNYVSVSSERLFLIPNILNRRTYIPKKIKNRKCEITLKFPYTDIDTLVFELPENIDPEFIPENVEKITKFGEYSAKTGKVNGELIYIRKMIMHKGKFPAEDYDALRAFFKFIKVSDKQTCVFKIKDN